MQSMNKSLSYMWSYIQEDRTKNEHSSKIDIAGTFCFHVNILFIA